MMNGVLPVRQLNQWPGEGGGRVLTRGGTTCLNNSTVASQCEPGQENGIMLFNRLSSSWALGSPLSHCNVKQDGR